MVVILCFLNCAVLTQFWGSGQEAGQFPFLGSLLSPHVSHFLICLFHSRLLSTLPNTNGQVPHSQRWSLCTKAGKVIHIRQPTGSPGNLGLLAYLLPLSAASIAPVCCYLCPTVLWLALSSFRSYINSSAVYLPMRLCVVPHHQESLNLRKFKGTSAWYLEFTSTF